MFDNVVFVYSAVCPLVWFLAVLFACIRHPMVRWDELSPIGDHLTSTTPTTNTDTGDGVCRNQVAQPRPIEVRGLHSSVTSDDKSETSGENVLAKEVHLFGVS